MARPTLKGVQSSILMARAISSSSRHHIRCQEGYVQAKSMVVRCTER